jgi:hypothetical protein
MKDQRVEGKIILKWIFEKWYGGGGKPWTESMWLSIETGEGLL